MSLLIWTKNLLVCVYACLGKEGALWSAFMCLYLLVPAKTSRSSHTLCKRMHLTLNIVFNKTSQSFESQSIKKLSKATYWELAALCATLKMEGNILMSTFSSSCVIKAAAFVRVFLWRMSCWKKKKKQNRQANNLF